MRRLRVRDIAVVFLVAVFVVLTVNSGCKRRATDPPTGHQQDNPRKNLETTNTTQRMELGGSSNFIAQIHEPIEVIAWMHMVDYREPVRVKIWLSKGTWLVPERMFTISEAEERSYQCGKPLFATEAK